MKRIKLQMTLSPEISEVLDAAAARLGVASSAPIEWHRRELVRDAIRAVAAAVVKAGLMPVPLAVDMKHDEPQAADGFGGIHQQLEKVLMNMSPEKRDEAAVRIRATLKMFGLCKITTGVPTASEQFNRHLTETLMKLPPAHRAREIARIRATLEMFGVGETNTEAPVNPSARFDVPDLAAPLTPAAPPVAAVIEPEQMTLDLGVAVPLPVGPLPTEAANVLAWGTRLAIELVQKPTWN